MNSTSLGEYLLNSLHKLKSLKQDSICHLFLISHVIRFYFRAAFIYNYSILFNEDTDSSEKDAKRNRKATTTSQASLKSEKASLLNTTNTSYGIKRDRILRFFSSNNQSTHALNILNNNTSESTFSLFGVRPKANANNSRRGSMQSSLSSLASSFVSINDSDLVRSQFNKGNGVQHTKKVNSSTKNTTK